MVWRSLKRSGWLSVSLCTAALFHLEVAKANQAYDLNDGLSVMPQMLEGKESYEVAELIEALMQPVGTSNGFPWDTMANSDIFWNPAGVSFEDGTAFRNGLVRVNVLGSISTILRSRVEELFWSISLAAVQNPSFGANVIAVEPGGVDELSCFGVMNTLCRFDIEESLRNSGLDYHKGEICDVGLQRTLDLYIVSKQGYRDVYLVQQTDAGSGGAKTTLSMTMNSEVIPDERGGCY